MSLRVIAHAFPIFTAEFEHVLVMVDALSLCIFSILINMIYGVRCHCPTVQTATNDNNIPSKRDSSEECCMHKVKCVRR